MEGARAILSCASCRQRKLKCDRSQPCGNCLARNADCVYASNRRGRGAPHGRDGNPQLESRIRRLEQLITTMATQMPQQQQSGIEVISNNNAPRNSNSMPAETIDIKPGRMMSSDGQITYVSGTHWAALCNEVAELREYLDRGSLEEHHDAAEHPAPGSGPMLLEGLHTMPDIQDILSDIPPINIASRLVSQYFGSNEISSLFLHAPTFEKEYNRFWSDPKSALPAWVGLLFGVMTMGAFQLVQSKQDLPETLGNPVHLAEVFQRRSTECLILSKYSTAPGPYTMEALMLNAQTEFLRRRDANLGVWVLGGIIIRVALRMGYHRDPTYHPELSAFDGEMRRRIWAVILQLDILTSCQIGLPPMIQESQCDAGLPSNLLDDDFGPDSTELPPSRPETELTPILYIIAKSRISSVFRMIFNQVLLGRIEAYAQIMALDQRLEDAYKAIPPRLKMSNLSGSVTIPPHLLMRGYNLELLSLKARCILHRRHMTKSYTNSKYAYSRTACIDAAMAILKHQADIMQEIAENGRLHQFRWFINSLELNDFLLASMIICIEVSFRAHEPASKSNNGHQSVRFSQQDLVEALQSARGFFDGSKASSVEAKKASNLLSVMLAKVSETSKLQEDQISTTATVIDNNDLATASPHANDFEAIFGSESLDKSYLQCEPIQASHTAFSSTVDASVSFLNTTDIIDWDQWEAFVQGSHGVE